MNSAAFVLMVKLAALMIMVIVGYAAVKFHVVESRESATISRLIVYILQPCLICRAYQIEITPERVSGFLCALGFGLATYIIWILLLRLLGRPLKLDAVDQCNLIFSNCGNLALPLISMIMSSEYVFYASALQIPFNLFIWTYGISYISGQKHLNFRKILLNPNIIALVTGLLLCFFRIRLPDAVDTAMASLGNMVGPGSMLVIGMVVAESDLGRVFRDKRAYAISLGRLVFMPATLLLLLLVTGIPGRLPLLVPVFQVCFIALSTPPSSTVSQLTVLFDKKAYETGVYNVLSMILCIVTMPLMLALFQMLFL